MSNSTLHRIPLEDEFIWNDTVRGIGWPAHSFDYQRALAAGTSSNVSLMDFRHGDGRLIVPVIERCDVRARDLVTPYGLGGMIVQNPSHELFSRFGEELGEQGYVAGYLQFDVATPWGSWQDGLDIRGDNEVFVLDLTDENLELLNPRSENLREKLRVWERLDARIETDIERLMPAFLSLFPTTMVRVGASPTYDFAAENLIALLKSEETTMFGGVVGGHVEAVSVFRRWGLRADYLFNASTDAGRGLSAKLLLLAAQQFRSDGIELFCLGGGARRGDGLAQFKRRFGGIARPLRALCQVYHRARFDQLCAEVRVDAGWFPPYRAPAAVGSTQSSR